jgi:hypothetical protein
MKLLLLWQQQRLHRQVAAAAMCHHQWGCTIIRQVGEFKTLHSRLAAALELWVHYRRLLAGAAAGAALWQPGVLLFLTLCRRRLLLLLLLLQLPLLRSRRLQHVLRLPLLRVGRNSRQQMLSL